MCFRCYCESSVKNLIMYEFIIKKIDSFVIYVWKTRINLSYKLAPCSSNFERHDITAFNFDDDLRWHRYSSNICHNTKPCENLPLLSMGFVYMLDHSTRYTTCSFRSFVA